MKPLFDLHSVLKEVSSTLISGVLGVYFFRIWAIYEFAVVSLDLLWSQAEKVGGAGDTVLRCPHDLSKERVEIQLFKTIYGFLMG